MTGISLESGETLRIVRRGRAGSAAHALHAWWRRLAGGWREQRHAIRLAQLDERTLKDIGLAHCAGTSLAARVHAHRQHELRRLPWPGSV